jgi:hypothetical protein
VPGGKEDWRTVDRQLTAQSNEEHNLLASNRPSDAVTKHKLEGLNDVLVAVEDIVEEFVDPRRGKIKALQSTEILSVKRIRDRP